MAYKSTYRGGPAAIIRRTYRCDECEYQFSWSHGSTDEAAPECPQCAVRAIQMPSAPAITTNKSRALDFAQSMAEDMGLTDMNDNLRPGDVAYKAPSPMQGAEKEALTRELVQAGATEHMAQAIVSPEAANFWQGGIGGAPSMDSARAASQAQAAQGVDAIGLLEKGRETGSMNIRYDVVGRAKG